MIVSVIIPTYNGAHKLPFILSSLENQTFRGFEVIVVVDGSTDNTITFLNNFNFNFLNFKVINQENKGRSVSRNNGAKTATGDLLIFFDDDMRPEPNCLEVHLQHHYKFESSILIGPTLEDYKVLTSDVQRYKAYLSRKWLAPIANLRAPLKKEQLYLTAANFSISRNLFFGLGGFDESLTDAEDFDLGVQAFKKGIPIYFDENAMAWHDDFITAVSYLNRLKQYKEAHKKLKELKPKIYTDFVHHQSQPAQLYKRFVYKFFSNSIWINIIDEEVLKSIFPKKLRYRLYDYIFASHII
jgi:glycosyltransferase involved in cell wall biosynthesis